MEGRSGVCWLHARRGHSARPRLRRAGRDGFVWRFASPRTSSVLHYVLPRAASQALACEAGRYAIMHVMAAPANSLMANQANSK